jgi:hypothetical protein
LTKASVLAGNKTEVHFTSISQIVETWSFSLDEINSTGRRAAVAVIVVAFRIDSIDLIRVSKTLSFLYCDFVRFVFGKYKKGRTLYERS